MSKWKNIPTKFKWDGESITGVSGVLSSRPKPRPAQRDNFDDKVVVAQAQTEAALDRILGLVKVEESVQAVPAVVAEPVQVQTETAVRPEPKDPDPKPVITKPVTDEINPELWEKPTNLGVSGSAIYPDGRPVKNFNHLMLFISNGAEIVRKYKSNGWVSNLRRGDGKENPVDDSLIDTLIGSGTLREVRDGVYRGGR